MKGIYLGAYRAYHPNYDLVYQDINGLRDIGGDMLDVDLSLYDFIIATPPCNAWSHANSENRLSDYALNTRHLLPDILNKLRYINKPYIVENVRNYPRFCKYGVLPRSDCLVYFVGRHTYWTNVLFNTMVDYDYDFRTDPNGHCEYIGTDGHREGGKNVYRVMESWLKEIHYNPYVMLKYENRS